MKKKIHFTRIFLSLTSFMMILLPLNLMAQNSDYYLFKGNTDVGKTELKGSLDYNADNQTYTITGSGENIWFSEDAFHYAWIKAEGDFIMRARLSFLGEGKHEHRKTGIMIRENLSSGSAHVSAVVHGDGLTSLQYREKQGDETMEIKSEDTAPDILQIERSGNTIIMSAAKFGETFTVVSKENISLEKSVYVGLFICSHDKEVKETVRAENVRFIKPAGEDIVPYRDYLGSHIEVMEVESGLRKIIYSEPVSLQAPNWTTDGKDLIYNSQGLLFRLPLDKPEPEKINTGFAKSNNNDHVLSFDGKQLGISSHAKDAGGKSVIYILPSSGGKPERITQNSPSYLHGWSPDGKNLVFTGERNGKYDIYKINIDDKNEIRLTDAEGLDDGSEYTPDGEYIYFNSSRTGSMEIWRMKPDGNGQEQLTSDGYNNWFPHISPDGKQIVFLSYGNDVAPDAHPFYKHVYLRIMPAEGGEARVIAIIYGGQGTINVPSWSPDGKKIAFVSNTGMQNPGKKKK